MPLGLFKGVRTFTLEPQNNGTVQFTLREVFSGPLLPLIGRQQFWSDALANFARLAENDEEGE